MLRLLGNGRKVEHRSRPGSIGDGAASQGVGADADAVAVEIAVLHGVVEPQRVRTAARGVAGCTVVRADGERQPRHAGDMDDLGELDVHGDHIALPVGVRRRRDSHVGDAGHRQPGVHGLPGVRRQALERADGLVAGRVEDRSVGERNRSGPDADAVAVEVARLHDVAECQRRGAAARCEAGQPRRRADGQFQGRLPADENGLVEFHLNFDRVARPVGHVGHRCDRHARHRRRDRVEVRVDPVSGLRRQARQPPFRRPGLVARDVLDDAADQGVRPDADAVVVPVLRLDPVRERERVGTAAVRVERAPGVLAHGQHEFEFAVDLHHVHDLVEPDLDLDGLAEAVGRAVGRGDDLETHGGRAHGVDAVPGLRREGGEVPRHVRAFGILDAAPRQRPGSGRDADAVVVEVPGLHGVPEPQHRRAAAAVECRHGFGAADRYRQLGQTRLLRRAPHEHRLRERDTDVDVLAHAVRVAARRRRPNGEPGLFPAAVDPVAALRRHALQQGVHRIAGVVVDRTVIRLRPAAQRVGAHADAVVVAVLFDHHVAEAQRPRSAAGDEQRVSRMLADGDAQHQIPVELGDMHVFRERHREHDGLAKPVGVAVGGLGDDRRTDRQRFDAVDAVRGDVRQRHQPPRGIAVDVDDVADQRVGVDADAIRIPVAVPDFVAERQLLRPLPKEARPDHQRRVRRARAERQRELRCSRDNDALVERDIEFDHVAAGVGPVHAGV